MLVDLPAAHLKSVFCKCAGLTSVGIDVIFHDVEFVYGIPEHADSLALKSTLYGLHFFAVCSQRNRTYII